MKITKRQLKQIIKEELNYVLKYRSDLREGWLFNRSDRDEAIANVGRQLIDEIQGLVEQGHDLWGYTKTNETNTYAENLLYNVFKNVDGREVIINNISNFKHLVAYKLCHLFDEEGRKRSRGSARAARKVCWEDFIS